MDDRALAMLAEDNMIRAALCWARAAEGGFVREDGAVVLTSVSAPMRSFNQIIVREPIEDGAALLRGMRDHFSGAGRFRLRVREEVGLAPDVVAGAGLVRGGGIPSMVLESPARQEPGELDVLPVSDERTLLDHVRLVADAFDYDPSDLGTVFTPELLSDPAWLGWVGYISGEPVCTSHLLVDGDTAGIYWVATAEQQRGRGFGAVITRSAVDEAARRGCSMVGLQASPLGKPVYERMGFRVVAEYETYLSG
jgi:GNAT superfamily N-acetyltransferase